MSCVVKLEGFNNHLSCRVHTVWESNLTSTEGKENARSPVPK